MEKRYRAPMFGAVLAATLALGSAANAAFLTSAPISYGATPYSQNFDGSVAAEGQPTAMPAGWFGGVGATVTNQAIVDSNPPNSASLPPDSIPANFYSFGAGTERALGSYTGAGSPTLARYFGVELVNNNTPRNILQLDFSVEQYGTVPQALELLAFISPTRLQDGTGTDSLNFALANNFAELSPGGNFMTGSYSLTIDLAPQLGNWQSGSYLYLVFRDRDTNGAGNTSADLGAPAIDDITSLAVVPEPSTWIAGSLLVGFVGLSVFRRKQEMATA